MNRMIAILIAITMTAPILSAQEMELVGKVLEVEEIATAEGDVNIIQVQVQTQNREMVRARLGPVWMTQNDVQIGDEITCRGKYDEETRFMAREFICNNVRYRVRGEDYEPLWLRTRLREQNQIYNPQNEKQMKGKIMELYVDESSSMMEAIIKPQDQELIRVRLAPEWYLRNQVRVGDELELRGAAVTDDGEIMIMAREMRNVRTNLEIALRNQQGFPDWYGKGKSVDRQHGKPSYHDEHVGRGRGRSNQ